MKFTTVLIAAPLAAAFRVPDLETFSQIPLEDNQVGPARDARIQELENAPSAVQDAIDSISSHVADAVSALDSKLSDGIEQLFAGGDEEEGADQVLGGDLAAADHDLSNLTIYEIVSKSKYTTKFAKLVSENQALVDLLSSTDGEQHTLFVPVDSAFDRIPKDWKLTPEDFDKILRYHIGLGVYSRRRLLATHTLPTALEEALLGGQPQRLRTRAGLTGLRVNFYDRVIASNIQASNGIIHGVKNILLPPPYIGKELNLFPELFSTYLLAMEKTDFVKFVHSVKAEGATMFAPSNRAFARLGGHANGVLFNTDKGLRYLKALLKYSTVVNTTLYSDAVYTAKGEQDLSREQRRPYHVDLDTLLEGAKIAVDISRWGGWVRLRVNGYTGVAIQDGISKNGVIHVVDHVLLPPRKHHGPADYREDGEVDWEDLQARLAPYLEDDGGDSTDAWSDL